MVKEKMVKTVTEDIVIGGENGVTKYGAKSFGIGYDNFKFPLTVSFCEHGEYVVKINGKNATVEKIK